MIAIISDYRNDIPRTSELSAQLRSIAEAGFTHVHWGHEWIGTYLYADSEMEQIRSWFDELGLRSKAVHASDGGATDDDRKNAFSLNEYSRLAGVELIKNRIELASRIDAQEIVLHLQYPFNGPNVSPVAEEEYWRQVFKTLDEIRPFASRRDVRIALENLLYTPTEQQILQLDRLFDRYPSDYLGFCFDAAHAYLMGQSDPLQLARRYLERLVVVHLSDNQGIDPDFLVDDGKVEEADTHSIPFEGCIDWEETIEVIARSPYELPLILEVCLGPGEDDGQFLQSAIEAGGQLTELFHRQRDARPPSRSFGE